MSDFVFHDLGGTSESLVKTVLKGLTAKPKKLPCHLLYDELGSQLFEAICETPEYYLTRTELKLLADHGAEMASLIGEAATVLEFGAGNTRKARLLLKHFVPPTTYLPIDISREHLKKSLGQLKHALPEIRVEAICADFGQLGELGPLLPKIGRNVLFFPGSTIGNFEPEEAILFLRRTAHLIGADGLMLIGVDLKKDPQRLHLAYNDSAGVTAKFEKNVLSRLNQELGAGIDLDGFSYRGFYNERIGRVEMFLVSELGQSFFIDGTTITFEANEAVHLENSYKYSLEEFRVLARNAGLDIMKTWCDPGLLFSVHLLHLAVR